MTNHGVKEKEAKESVDEALELKKAAEKNRDEHRRLRDEAKTAEKETRGAPTTSQYLAF